MEIGGFIEFPTYNGEIYHNKAVALNSARNCLAYLIETRKIKKIALPKFLCASVEQICKKYNIFINYYSIGLDFLPKGIDLNDDEWLYIVNYYGQLDKQQIQLIKNRYNHIIIDNVQAFFQMPVKGVDTIYTCRKYFGVSDGAYLYTEALLPNELEYDKSSKRLTHLFGRFEETANRYYNDYVDNEELIANLPLRKMSKITENILRSINYDNVKVIREQNFQFLYNEFSCLNKLKVKEVEGPFMYPLYISNGNEVRKKLLEQNIYIPTLWPDVFKLCKETELEYDMAKNILPLPCDQRYDIETLKLLVNEIKKLNS